MNLEPQHLICDGSWEIIIHVTDLNISETLRVKGDLRIGSIILMLVDKLAISRDWSDHAFWWPTQQIWLLRTKNTLDQYGVQANARIEFTPVHKFIALQTPDFKVNYAVLADFSIPVYGVVAAMCKDLGIRYPEELSLSRVYDRHFIKTGNKRSSSTSGSGRKTPLTISSGGGGGVIAGELSPYQQLGAGMNRSSSNFGSSRKAAKRRNASYNNGGGGVCEMNSISPYNTTTSKKNISSPNHLLSSPLHFRGDGSSSYPTNRGNSSGIDKSFDSGSDRPDSTYYALPQQQSQFPFKNTTPDHNTSQALPLSAPHQSHYLNSSTYAAAVDDNNRLKPLDESSRYSNGSSLRNGHIDKRASPYFSSDSGLNGIGSGNKNSSSIDDKHNSLLLYDSCRDLRETEYHLIRPKSYQEKSRINEFWLNSSLSLMEQGVLENQLLLLRFKYHAFFDLNPKLDGYRINLIFEQAKNAILYETIDFTDEEGILFAALHLQSLNSSKSSPNKYPTNHYNNSNGYNEYDQHFGTNSNGIYPPTTTTSTTTTSTTKATNKITNGYLTGSTGPACNVDLVDSSNKMAEFTSGSGPNRMMTAGGDIDEALEELQISLEYAAGESFFPLPPPPLQITSLNSGNITTSSNPTIKTSQPSGVAAGGFINCCSTTDNGLYSALEIKDTLKLIKPKKFPFKSYKTYFTVFKEGRIFCYENDSSYPTKPPLIVIDLKNSEIIPEVNVHGKKYNIKARVPLAKGYIEYCLKCENENQYAKWMAACRLAASNSGIVNDPQTYKAEMSSILAFLNIQASNLKEDGLNTVKEVNGFDTDSSKGKKPKGKAQATSLVSHHLSTSNLSPRNRFSTLLAESIYGTGSATLNRALHKSAVNNITLPRDLQLSLSATALRLEDIVPKRMIKKYKSSTINSKILDAYNTINGLTSLDAKMSYIRTWQSLPEFGFTYFTVKFQNSPKKEDIVAITSNRIVKIDVATGEHLKTWKFVDMQNWSVNWEIKMVILEFIDQCSKNNNNYKDSHNGLANLNGLRLTPGTEERLEKICFNCTCADCKIVHEFIGGYVFMSMRSKEENAQNLDETLFHKLTGGWN